MADSLRYAEYSYGAEHELQNLAVWEFPPGDSGGGGGGGDDDDAASSSKLWFVYIHGGAWRDPRVLMDTFVPTINRVLEESGSREGQGWLPRSRVAGFASLNYRLSPHPAFPQDPAATPARRLRAARHPDHLRDVRAGLAALHRAVPGLGGSSRYVLAGHSCGAFLAFQVLMGAAAFPGPEKEEEEEEEEEEEALELATPPLPLPVCVVGIEGLYDVRGADARMGGALREICEGAFGPDPAAWDAASPGLFRGGFRRRWARGLHTATPATAATAATKRRKKMLAVLAYSPEDELVDAGEIDTMERTLRAEEGGEGDGGEDDGVLRVLALRDLRGRHDEVREDGREVARVLGRAVAELDRLEAETEGE